MFESEKQSTFESVSNAITTHCSMPIHTLGLKHSAILDDEVLLPFVSPPALETPYPTITCICPCLPNHNFFEAALESILKQTIQPNNIFFCVDGEPKTKCQLSSLLHDKIDILRSNKRIGPYKIVDHAIRSTDSELIWLHDSDDLSHPWRLQLQLARLIDLDLDAVGTGCLYFSEKSAHAVGIFPSKPQKALKAKYGHILLHPTLLMKRNVYLKLGGFSDFAPFGMDSEFSIRLSFHCKVRNLPWPVYYKREWDGALTSDNETGFGSPAREAINIFTKERYQWLLSRQKDQLQYV